ncbi:MAG TPA: MlaD family protein [Aliidongia sp.]|nr:MlaD family protein [Aliidongia sp.]
METRANYIAIGAFVLVIAAGLFISMLWLAGAQFRTEYEYFATRFQGPVTGLGTGAAVRLNGIEIGRVTNIEFDPTDPKLVLVVLQVREGILLHADSVASLETQGLTGVSYVEISGGTQSSPPLEAKEGERYRVITSRPSNLQEVVNGAPELVAKLLSIADKLTQVLNEQNQKALADTLANLRDTTAVFDQRSKEIDQLITDGGTTMHNLAGATNQLPGLIDKFDHVAGQIDVLARSADETAKQAGRLTNDIDSLVVGVKPQLHDLTTNGFEQLNALLVESRSLVQSLNRVSNALERDPSRFLFGERREGYKPK